MPRKAAENHQVKETQDDKERNEIERLNDMLEAVLNYISDDEIEVIDIEYLLNNTDGLREWWDQYRERNRKNIEEEIVQSLGSLSIEALEELREKIRGKEKE
ncbi:hypothetical protein [Mesobacillus subterraneus]|uniref:Uncharacterized protein n=1 Tax=Mesobacillus subterraneus TaxID=285983 RepID=A0A0D6Z6R8_9BACI|nr:hypothetical protein [Mesobacillus subterraneus]KIY21469.1 hypothetical protein UB32_13655 [Mesobacillus subterraneus]